MIKKHTGFLFEEISQVRGIHLALCTEFLDGKAIRIMLMDIVDGILDDGAELSVVIAESQAAVFQKAVESRLRFRIVCPIGKQADTVAQLLPYFRLVRKFLIKKQKQILSFLEIEKESEIEADVEILSKMITTARSWKPFSRISDVSS